jgi:hypothetical protein
MGRLTQRLQNDLVRADTEELPEPAHLGDLRHPSSTLPEVNRLGLDAHPQRQRELGPSVFLPQLPNGLHRRTSWYKLTITEQLLTCNQFS